MGFKRFAFCNLQFLEKLMGVTCFIIICAQHLGGKGFSEATRSADAGQPARGFNGLVDQPDHTAFIDIIIATDSTKTTIARV